MLYNMERMDGLRACPQPPGLPAALGLQPGEAVPISASLSVLLDGLDSTVDPKRQARHLASRRPLGPIP